MADNKNNGNVGRSIYLDTTSAQTALKKLTDQQEILTRAINQGEKAGKDMSNEIAQMGDLKNKMKPIQDAIDKGMAPSLRELQKTVSSLRNELKGMSTDAPGFAAKLKAYNAASKDLDGLKTKLGQVSDASNKVGGSFLSFAKTIAGVAVASFGLEGMIGFLKGSIEEADAAEQSMSRLHNTLENIGRVDAFERLTSKAAEFQKQFKYLDNDDINIVFQKLISYGKLTERQINELLPVIVNFAAKNKISVEESSSVIIKALEGSGKALKEYGVNMKDGKDITERMSIIMQDLSPRVEGAADAFGKTFKGQLAIARQEIKDTQEEIGNNLVPILNVLLKTAGDAIKGMISMGGVLKNVFSGKSLFQSLAESNAEKIAEGDKKAEETAVNGIISAYKKDASGRLRSAQEVIDLINRDLQSDMQQLAIKQVSGDIQGQQIFENSIKNTKKALEKAQAELNPELDKVLGQGNKFEKIDEAAAAKMEELRKKFEDLINKLNEQAHQIDLSPMELEFLKINDALKKNIAEIQDLQSKGAIDAKQAADAIALAQKAAGVLSEEALQKELLSRKKKRGNTDVISTTDFIKQTQEENKKNDLKTPGTLSGKSSLIVNFEAEKKATDQLRVLNAKTLKEIRDTKLQQLSDEEADILAKTQATGDQRLLIEKEFADKRKGVEDEYKDKVIAVLNEIASTANQVFDIMSQFAQARSNIENQALARDIANNDKRKSSLLQANKKGLISIQEYTIQVQKMDQEIADKKRKLEAEQFERTRKQQIAQALINGAVGITKAWVTPGFPLAILYTALIAANTAAQIAVINSQKPQFAKGGILPGPSHADGGLPVMNPKTGRAVAEVEGGELILSKRFVSSNPSLVPELLYASRTGQRIMPFFMGRQYQQINYAAVSSAGSRKYADGGILNVSSSAGVMVPGVINNERMEQLLSALIKKLDQPSIAVISQRKIEDAASIKQNILNEAIFR
jgi:hypothetical protein